MSYDLGVDLGTTYTAAAVRRDGETRIVHLGTRSAAIPSVVLLKEDETFLVGEAARRRATTEPNRVAREFKRRIGDTTPLILGSTPYSAEALMARLLRWVVDEVTRREGGPPDSVVVTHPANWTEYKTGLLEQAIRLADIEQAHLITEPEAAAIYYASQERIETGRVIAVYDLGGGTFDAAILQKIPNGFAHLGTPEGIDRLGGIDFDEAVFEHVRRALVGAGADIDRTDPQTVAGLVRLRAECAEAKEALSSDSDVSVPVLLPSVQTEVRLTRTELEAMIRPSLADTIGAMRRAIRSADLELDAIDAILLVGGSSRIPLVSDLVRSELGRPVAVDAHPKHSIALGAALWDPAGVADNISGVASTAVMPAAMTPPLDDVVASPPVAPTEPAPSLASKPTVESAHPPAMPAAMKPPLDDVVASPPVVPVVPAAPEATRQAAATTPPTTEQPVAASQPSPTPPPIAPVETPSPAAAPPPRSTNQRTIAMVAGLAVVLVAAAIVFLMTRGGETPVEALTGTENTVGAATVTSEADVQPLAATTPPEPEAQATLAPAPTDVPAVEPTAAPTPSAVPTATTVPTATPLPFPPETRRTELSNITLVGSRYEVAYNTIQFEPVIGGSGTFHLHFHWDIYPPNSVGTGSSPQNPWVVWDLRQDGGKIFDQFGPAQAPQGATAICAVVANSAHAIDQIELVEDTVSCIDLPR